MTTENLTLHGGVDLTTPKHAVSPGRLLDCENFEIARYQGYSLIDGFVGHDGREAPFGFVTYNVQVRGASWVADEGDTMNFILTSSGQTIASLLIVGKETTTGPATTLFTLIGPAEHPIESDQWDKLTVGAETFTAPWTEEVNLPPLNATASLVAGYIDDIDPVPARVPGRPDSNVIGVVSFKDKVYAVRDMTSVVIANSAITSGSEPVEGQRVWFDYSPILTTIGQPYNMRIEAVDQESGSALEGGTMRLLLTDEFGIDPSYESSVSGFPFGAPEAGTLMHVAAFSNPPLMLGGCLGRWLGGGYAPFGLTTVGTVRSYPEADTKAKLWESSSGWRETQSVRELRFRAGTTALAALAQYTKFAYSRYAQGDSQVTTGTAADTTYVTTASTLPGSGASTGTKTGFTNAANVTATDNTYATLTLTGSGAVYGDVWAKNYDFSAIPDNATITGVKVSIERKCNAASAARSTKDVVVRLSGVNGNPPSLTIPGMSASNKASQIEWPTVEAAQTFGDANDLWGEAQIPVSRIKSGDFGVYLTARLKDDGTGTTGSIDSIAIQVSYINPTSVIYVRNTGAATESDIQVNVLRITKTAGSYDDSTAEGYITVTCPNDAEKRLAGRLMGAGDQLRSLASGAGDVYGYVAEPDRKVMLPPQAAMEAVDSRWQWHVASFYATDNSESLYGCNGAGPAIAFDGKYTLPIRTQLLPAYDTPRHVVRHGAHLALAYKQGQVLFSSITDTGPDPLNFDADDGSLAEEFGDAVTNMLPLNNDVLAIMCQSKIVALRGYTSSSFTQSVIVPNSGAIEYTAADIGLPVYCDNFGIGTVETTDRFGDFIPGRLSYDVWPFMQRRVQRGGEVSDTRVAFALAVRNKNQYRVVFRDGKIMSMTLWGAERTPMFMFTLYHDPRAARWDAPDQYGVYAAHSAVWSDGRERIFFSMDYSGTESETGLTQRELRSGVYEMDFGSTFLGVPIQGSVTFNWDTANASNVLKRFDRFWLYGAHSGYSQVKVSRANNFATPIYPDSTVPYLTKTIGDTDGQYQFDLSPYQICVDFPIEGFNVALRVDYTDTSFYGGIALQGADFIIDNRGASRGLGR